MSKAFDVICVGPVVVDLPLQPVDRGIFDVPSYPVDQIQMTVGGDAMNESVILHRLGYRTALMSMTGADIPGNFIRKTAEDEGVDTSGVRVRDDVVTSINVGLVTPDGERTFVTNRNGSLWKMTIDDVDLEAIRDAKILSLASIFNSPGLDGPAMVKIAQKAKREGMKVCADIVAPRIGEKLEDIRETLSYLDYFFPNYEEAASLTGESDLDKIADVLLSCGVGNVIIKTGSDGCFVKNASESFTVPAVPGIRALDTIGAGDNFAAGFISALLEGKSLRDCARFANATASLSVQALGATGGVQDRKQVEERYRQAYKTDDTASSEN